MKFRGWFLATSRLSGFQLQWPVALHGSNAQDVLRPCPLGSVSEQIDGRKAHGTDRNTRHVGIATACARRAGFQLPPCR